MSASAQDDANEGDLDRKCPPNASHREHRDHGQRPTPSPAADKAVAPPYPLVLALKRQRIAQDAERLLAGSMQQERGRVFATETGGPIDPHSDWKDWRALLNSAGVRTVRLHDARHTAATLLLTQGVPARVAMQILGHSQISLTLGTYSHVVPELARDAAERIGSALWGDPTP